MANQTFNSAPYEGTEVITFTFSDPSARDSLSDENTEAGKTFATTLRVYLENEHTGTVWWASVHDAPNKTKLFIDWKTLAGKNQFENTAQATLLANNWKTITSSPVIKETYKFNPSNAVARQTALSSTYETVSVCFTFRFNSAIHADHLDGAFQELNHAIMLSPGAVVASYSIGGWSVDRTSYCACYRYLNAKAMRNFVHGDTKVRDLVGELEARAAGFQMEFFETKAFEQGWQGSVMKTVPDNPVLSGFMSEMQDLFSGIDGSTLRGER
ncbi:uncharacterized protein B0J16DRAFT_349932 [Fusarium flagelliforme]|uniref:uncharacterized protein n=1 Tax=Fusarium flagelliforme TaxID=2675880 RepID=UPI001E8DA9C7|nr:uncharacterized protein B0J16DRAFT_349932 [Fusarium flagelliforme]KAH7173352.1 hypothetical protein B0J16DRAFT_349932 [Fusarium flagelliforme]